MKRKFISNLLLLVILNMLIKPFWFFGIEVGVQNAVGETMYGFYFSLFNFAFIGNILLDTGITNYNNRAISRNPNLLSDNLATIIPIKLMLSIVYAVVIFVSATIVGYSKVQINLLIILAFNQFLSSFILYLRSNISGLQLFRTDSLLSVLDRALMIVINSVLLWSGFTNQPYKIEWFVYSQSVSYLITVSIVFAIVLHHSGKLNIVFDILKGKNILKKSYPFAILILLMSFFNRADSVMLERMLENGKEQAGIYAQSFRILDALSQFSLLFAALLLPMFSRMIKMKERTDELVQISSSLLLSAAVAAAVAGIFYNQEIIELLYGPTKGDSPFIFSILMIGFLFISLSYIHGTLLTANNNLKLLNILAAITVIINIGLNLLLIPRMYAVGAAIASLCSQAFFASGQFIMTNTIFKSKGSFNLLVKLLIYGLVIGFVAWALKSLLHQNIIGFLLYLVLCTATSFAAGLIRPKEIITILRNK